MRTIANEEAAAVGVASPRRGSHLAQVRWGSHIFAALSVGEGRKKWITAVQEDLLKPIAQTSGECLELHESCKSWICALFSFFSFFLAFSVTFSQTQQPWNQPSLNVCNFHWYMVIAFKQLHHHHLLKQAQTSSFAFRAPDGSLASSLCQRN